MNSIEEYLDLLTALASLSAVTIAVLSFQTYRDIRPSAQIKRRQDEHMNHLVSVILELYDHMRTFAAAQNRGLKVDPYRYGGASYGAKLLSELLDECARLDLTKFTLGRDHELRWDLYEAFRSGLLELHHIDLNSASPKDFTKQHFTMGMLRLAQLCMTYEPLPLKEDLAKQVNADLPLREEAWNYLYTPNR